MSDLTAGGAEAPAPAPPTIDVNPPPVGAAPPPPAQPVLDDKGPSLDETLSAAWDKAQRNGVERGEDGKFKSDKPAEQIVADETTEQAVQPTTEGKTEPALPAIDPPHSWTAEGKELWAKLPPEFRRLQEIALSRDGESHKQITSQGERIKSHEPVERVINEFKDEFSRRSLTPDQGIRALIEAQRMLDANPIHGLVTIARTYGIDLQSLLSGQPGAVPQADPAYGQLRQELAQVRGELKKYTDDHSASQQAADVALVKEFASKADATGKPLYPHFEELRQDMAFLLNGGRVTTLEAAYQMASRLNETVSKRIEADQRKAAEESKKAEEARKQAEEKKRAEEAAKAAKVNVKSTITNPSSKTLDDDLRAIAARHYG